MLNIALYEPEIPPNTGNIIRLCANTGSQLHLIHPLGFSLTDKQLRRAGLDYHEWASIIEYQDYPDFLKNKPSGRLIALTTKATQPHSDLSFQDNDILLLGPESRGLPLTVRHAIPLEQQIRIPMKANSRSLNLSNAASIVVYEAWRQMNYK